MNTTLLYLLIEDVFSLALVITLLYLKRRPYVTLAIILLVLILVTNILYFSVLHNAFIGGVPLIFFAFTGPSLGRFNPHLRISDAKKLKVLLIIFTIILLFCILGLLTVTFMPHTK